MRRTAWTGPPGVVDWEGEWREEVECGNREEVVLVYEVALVVLVLLLA